MLHWGARECLEQKRRKQKRTREDSGENYAGPKRKGTREGERDERDRTEREEHTGRQINEEISDTIHWHCSKALSIPNAGGLWNPQGTENETEFVLTPPHTQPGLDPAAWGGLRSPGSSWRPGEPREGEGAQKTRVCLFPPPHVSDWCLRQVAVPYPWRPLPFF